MANKVTGTTDTSGALSIAPSTPKSLMIIGKRMSPNSTDSSVGVNTIFSIQSTNDVVAEFGDKSPLVEAVKILIKNGVDYMNGIIADVKEQEDEDDTAYAEKVSDAYSAALNASLDDETVKVILLDTNKQIDVLKTHLQYAEENDMFRYAVIAPDNIINSQSELTAYAKEIDYSRIFIPGPNMVGRDASAVDPVVQMAGLSEVIMTETSDPALPHDGVQIKGLYGVDRRLMKAEKDILSNNGITPLYTSSSMPTIHRLVTSCITDKVYQEGTTRFIADYVLETVENTLRQNYKRTKNVDRILGDTGIRGTIKTVLNTMQDLEIIENFDESTLTVIKDPKDMYGALVDYEIDVVTPLYTITITQHLKL